MSALVRHLRSGRGPRSQSITRCTIRLGFGALVAASLACGGSESTGPEAIEGTYALQTIGARSLPVVVLQDETGKFEVTAGSLTLRAPDTFTMSLSFRQTAGAQVGTVTSSVDGTWTRSGANMTLVVEDEPVLATLSGSTIKMMGEAEDLGMVEWVFRK